jgi:hypothetical protein
MINRDLVIDLKYNRDIELGMGMNHKVGVKYQQNPTPNWGPAKAAAQGAGPKKRTIEGVVVFAKE